MEHYPEPYRDYEPIQPKSFGWRDMLRRIWAPVAAVGAFLVKFGAFLFKLKIFTVAGSMIVSIGAYALLGGWWFGLGLVALIFVHEMGHVIELRRQGVPASAPLFIPFFGAFVGMKQLPDNAWKEAQVALAGPILGSIGAAAVYGVAEYLDSDVLRGIAFVGFLINLFNLLPVVPLDGGRAVAALHPAIWFVGLLGLAAFGFLYHSPIVLLVLLMGALELWRRWQNRHSPEFAGYYRVKPWQRIAVGVVYVGLALLLALGMHATIHPGS
jgi:Zn-dependent protease